MNSQYLLAIAFCLGGIAIGIAIATFSFIQFESTSENLLVPIFQTLSVLIIGAVTITVSLQTKHIFKENANRDDLKVRFERYRTWQECYQESLKTTDEMVSESLKAIALFRGIIEGMPSHIESHVGFFSPHVKVIGRLNLTKRKLNYFTSEVRSLLFLNGTIQHHKTEEAIQDMLNKIEKVIPLLNNNNKIISDLQVNRSEIEKIPYDFIDLTSNLDEINVAALSIQYLHSSHKDVALIDFMSNDGNL